MDPDLGHFFKIYRIFLTKNFQFFCFFSLIFILKLDEPFRNEEFFRIYTFFKKLDLGFRIKSFFLQFLVDILPFGSGSMDTDPGSQNLADPTDPDP